MSRSFSRLTVASTNNKKVGLQQSLNQHHPLYHHILTLCSEIFKQLVVLPSPGVQYVRHCKQMLLLYRNKVCASQTPQWNRKNQTQHCSYLCFTPNTHRPHTPKHTVSREHSPGTAAQTNTLKIQTTHIQTLSLLNELALLKEDSQLYTTHWYLEENSQSEETNRRKEALWDMKAREKKRR